MSAATSKPIGSWRARFSFDHIKPLIVCRGPIRQEAIEVFEQAGTKPCGILLSEKDSVVYPRALAPELRRLGRNERVHRIPDYMGVNAEEKARTIRRIIEIARDNGYTHIFAGYGFMAEDHEFIGAIERAGLGFIGPASSVVRQAGAKDAAKTLARELGVSVTPGVDNIMALTLLAQAKGDARKFLEGLATKHKLKADLAADDVAVAAERLIMAGLEQGVELVTTAQLQAQAEQQVADLLKDNPGRRLRFKHIGGGGGKGQRIIGSAKEAANAVSEVLAESKATGPADNKNFLIELNIEQTRHNEIQLLGNGSWCIALGGRDCSLQMHEQKLVEVSITEELLQATADSYREKGKTTQADVIAADLKVLQAMESEAETFGQAVGLNSASTFECIVDGTNHYFMEVNTRIQVEHRVTEMVYALRFHSPERPEDYFEVDSLVEAMLWMAAHGDALPRPQRVPRQLSGAEVRINATNDALQPHAGGVVQFWSPPIEHEIRDDQGIGITNPDTDQFMPYNLAGAYDSNAALVVTYGADRLETYQRMAEILRRTEIRGDDVITNATFHYGLIHWMIGTDAMVKPGTRFVQAYLAAVGILQQAAGNLDLDAAWQYFQEAAQTRGKSATAALEAKTTLLQRPMRRLFSKAHLLAGWLAPRPQRRFIVEDGCVIWQQNPLAVLQQLYAYLHLEEKPGVSPQEQIWLHDSELLAAGLAFYRELDARLGRALPWAELDDLLAQAKPPKGITAAEWPAIQAAHRGHQVGLDLLKLPILCGEDAGFYALTCDARLEPIVDKRLYDAALLKEAQAALAPPPPASSNEIVAWTGGTFYARPSPDAETYVNEGSHVEAGEVVGLLEVMKMFNPVRAEFAGTIKTTHLTGDQGVIVGKGQTLFEMEPDTPPTTVPPEELAAQRTEQTLALVKRC